MQCIDFGVGCFLTRFFSKLRNNIPTPIEHIYGGVIQLGGRRLRTCEALTMWRRLGRAH